MRKWKVFLVPAVAEQVVEVEAENREVAEAKALLIGSREPLAWKFHSAVATPTAEEEAARQARQAAHRARMNAGVHSELRAAIRETMAKADRVGKKESVSFRMPSGTGSLYDETGDAVIATFEAHGYRVKRESDYRDGAWLRVWSPNDPVKPEPLF